MNRVFERIFWEPWMPFGKVFSSTQRYIKKKYRRDRRIYLESRWIVFSSGFWQSFFLFEEQKLRHFHIFKGPFHPSSHPRCNFSAPPRRDSTMASIRGYGCAAVEMVRQNLDAGGRLLAEWVVLIGGCSRDTNPGARTGIDLDVLSLSLSAFSILAGSCVLIRSIKPPPSARSAADSSPGLVAAFHEPFFSLSFSLRWSRTERKQ